MNIRIPHDYLTKDSLILTLPEAIFGAEENEGDNNGNTSESNSTTSSEQQSNNSSDSSGDNGEEDDGDKNPAGLRSALEKERRERKRLERENKLFLKEKEAKEAAEKSEAEKATDRANKIEAKLQKLAEGYRMREVNDAIRKAAREAKFIDPDDAIAGVDIDLIEIEQDEEDPSRVTIDTKAVTRLVKELASKKPHFIASGTEDGEPTGGKFGSKQQSQKDPDEAIREMYPALRSTS